MKITILGARGSIPVSGKEYHEFGGATACVMAEVDEQVILLDGGSGLLNLAPGFWRGKTMHLFFSHFHLDHVIGLMMSPMMFDAQAKIVMHAPKQLGNPKTALEQLMQHPIWPIGPGHFLADISYDTMDDEEKIGDFLIKSCKINHPGDAYGYKLCDKKKQFAYFTDCELSEDGICGNEDWLKDSNLVIMDGQYSTDDYERCKGFGHTAMDLTAHMLHELGAKQGLIFHHDPKHTDEFLRLQEKRLQTIYPEIAFAREGEVIEL